MSDKHAATYLNDHLAGSVLALELLAQLERNHAEKALGRFAAELYADILPDREELESLMRRLSIPQSGFRKATAWVAEKVADLKMRMDDSPDGALHLLEVLETVAIGIEGKRMLWRSLETAAENSPGLRGPEYWRLEKKAMEQRERVEAFRLEAAKGALRLGG
jgi:hypothetical protein